MTPTRTSIPWILFSVSAVLLAGCVTSPKRDAAAPAPRLSPRQQEALAEKRVEAQARYAAGLAFELRREPDKALEEFIKSVAADPSNEELALEVSRRLLLKKDLSRALELGELAADQPGASAIAYAQLAVLYAEAGKLKEAEQANRKAIELAPDTLIGYYNLYTLQLNQGENGKARAVLEAAAARDVASADYWLDLAELFANFFRARPAEKVAVAGPFKKCLDRARELGVTNPLRLQKLADGYALAGDNARAVEILLGVLAEDFDDVRTRDMVRQKLVALYLTGQDNEGALVQLEAMVRDHPTNPQANFLLATVAYEKKDFAKAADYYRKSIQLKPDFEQAYYSLTTVLLESNQDQAAIELLAVVREKYPNSFVAEYFSGVVYSRLENHAKAVEHYTLAEIIAKATMPSRLDHFFYFQMGAQLERAQRLDEAAATFQRCLDRKADFAPALNYLGYMWADQGTNLEAARKLIQKAVDLEPKNAAYLDSLAWVLFKLGEPKAALTHIEAALQYQEEPDATLFDHLGDIHLAAGNPGEARKAWEQSVKLEPDAKVQKKLDALIEPAEKPTP